MFININLVSECYFAQLTLNTNYFYDGNKKLILKEKVS